jgi:hypothetical protein
VEAVLDQAAARRDKEGVMMERLRGGATTMELLGLTPILDELARDREEG